ncbi:MAG: MMPL family transporter [Pseudomonadales bacterium]|nr:MMPL family transporter [Pseudomonadales bacterium]
MATDLGTWLVQHRFKLAVVALLVTIIGGWGVQFTRFDGTNESLFAEADEYKAEVDQARVDFPSSAPRITMAFEVDGDIFNLRTLTAIDELTRRYIEIDSAIALSSILTYRVSEADKEILGRSYLFPDLDDITEADLQQIKTIALNDEDLTQARLTSAGNVTLATISYSVSEDTSEARLAVAESAVVLRDSLRQQYPEIRIYLVGGPMFERDSNLAREKDNKVLLPLVVIAGVLLLWFCLGSLLSSIALSVVALTTIIVTIGIHALLDIPLNQISRLGPAVAGIVAFADGIHVLSVYAQKILRGTDRKQALIESININFRPIALATVTTTMGFLSLNLSSAPAIYGFGNIVALGVIWAFFFTVFLLPAMILLIPARSIAKPLGVSSFIEGVLSLVARREKTLFWGFLGLIVVTLFMLPLNKLDNDPFDFIDEGSDLSVVVEIQQREFENDRGLAFVVRSNEYYGITNRDFLDKVDDIATQLEADPQITWVSTYTDYLKLRNKAANDDDEAYEVIPQDQLTVIDYLVGYQLVAEIDPNLGQIFNKDYSAIYLYVATSGLSDEEILQLANKIDVLAENYASESFQVTHANNTILGARLNQIISTELFTGFSLSLVMITLTMMIGLRSLRYGLLSIAPNVFPITIVFGLWGLIEGNLSPYVLMLLAVSIGLVVDDSVHVLSKYKTARDSGKSPGESIEDSISLAGSAITITTLWMSVGIALMGFSSTTIFQNLTSIITPIIVVALFLDLLFLPSLLTRFDSWIDRTRPSKETVAT